MTLSPLTRRRLAAFRANRRGSWSLAIFATLLTLVTLTGMSSVAMSPKAGAHGELCGILAIKAALAAKGEGHRKTILVPESAHGTNPATAAFAGYAVEDIPATADGRESWNEERMLPPMSSSRMNPLLAPASMAVITCCRRLVRTVML